MNPEDEVIDAIDALVNEQLTHRPDDYDRPYKERCELCSDEWHGMRDGYGCPGAFATEGEKMAFRRRLAGESYAELSVTYPDGGSDREPGIMRLTHVPHGALVRMWDSHLNLIWSGRVGDGGEIPLPMRTGEYIIDMGEPWRLHWNLNAWTLPSGAFLSDEDLQDWFWNRDER